METLNTAAVVERREVSQSAHVSLQILSLSNLSSPPVNFPNSIRWINWDSPMHFSLNFPKTLTSWTIILQHEAEWSSHEQKKNKAHLFMAEAEWTVSWSWSESNIVKPRPTSSYHLQLQLTSSPQPWLVSPFWPLALHYQSWRPTPLSSHRLGHRSGNRQKAPVGNSS